MTDSPAGGPSSPGDADPPVDVDELGVVDPQTQEALSTYRQGDVLPALTSQSVLGPDGQHVDVSAPLGVVVVSQTCDVVLANRPAVVVARRVRLDESRAKEARAGKRPRFAHLPQIGERDFADLEVMSTVAKAQVAAGGRRCGVEGDDQVRRFANAVARKFARFAFPDEVSAWLQPLIKVIGSKSAKPNSPEGRALAQVVELRVEAASGWAAEQYELTLCVIVEPGTLPTLAADDLPDLPADLDRWLYDDPRGRTPSEIAQRLQDATAPEDLHWLWIALGEAWAAQCKPPEDASPQMREAVADVLSEVVPVDEFPLSRVRRSEILDLDHLSAPAQM